MNGSGLNGVAVHGNAVYATIGESVTGRVLRIPIDAPAATTVVADLAIGGLPDDLAFTPGGQLYVATTTGSLVRVNPDTHRVCTVLTGEPLTSLAVTPGNDRQLMAGTLSGNVLRIQLNT